MVVKLFLLLSKFLYKKYGYEGLNILFRVMPMTIIPNVLRKYGAVIGENVRIKAPITFNDAEHEQGGFRHLSIGNGVFIGRNCLIDLKDKIIIERNVTISHNVSLLTHTDAGNSPLSKTYLPTSKGMIFIKSGAYIGASVTILQGVIIGETSIVGSGSLVNRSISGNSVAYGIPAKVIKSIL